MFVPASTVGIVRDISPNGRYVVGQTTQGAGSRGFIWDRQSGNTITTFQSAKGEVMSVNNSGFLVGSFADSSYIFNEEPIRTGNGTAVVFFMMVLSVRELSIPLILCRWVLVLLTVISIQNIPASATMPNGTHIPQNLIFVQDN